MHFFYLKTIYFKKINLSRRGLLKWSAERNDLERNSDAYNNTFLYV